MDNDGEKQEKKSWTTTQQPKNTLDLIMELQEKTDVD